MHIKRWSKSLRKILSIGAISIILIPTVSQANTTMFNEPKNGFEHELKAEAIKIQQGVDTSTDKEISIIVEFKSLPKAIQKQTKSEETNEVNKEHEEFKLFLDKLNKEKSMTIEITNEYTQLFNGLSMKIKGSDVEKLLDSGVVKAIWNDATIQLDLPNEEEVNKQEEKSSNEIAPYMADSKPAIGVNKLHEEGLTGEGIKVGVIDTGIDYNHPDLQSSYQGEKTKDVAYEQSKGWDFVNNDSDPMETTYKEWQESGKPESLGNGPYYTSHGTHVSGTIAASPDNENAEFKTTGVAPDAQLYGYKVLGPYGTGSTQNIIAAVEKSFTDGMDVINMSLGSSINEAVSPISTICNNAMASGMVVVIANGNSGPAPGTVGSPGAAPLPISVGASSVSTTIDTFEINTGESKLNGQLLTRGYETPIEPLLDKDLEIVDCGFGLEQDFEGKDIKEKVALIHATNLNYHTRVANAKKNGAIAVIVYGDGSYNYIGEGRDYIPTIGVIESGDVLKSQTKINLSRIGEVSTKGDELAYFSSTGPTDTEDIKPDIVAPGVSIMSTVPEYMNHKEDGQNYDIAYSRSSGTSMASPHVAGVAALMIQDYKNNNEQYNSFDIKSTLMSTSDNLARQYAVNQMGAGRINAYEAIHSDLSIKVLDKDTQLGDNGEVEIDDITGALSYKYLYVEDNASETTKAIDVNLENKSSEVKNLEISVEFLGSEYGGLDANQNGVNLEIPQNITVNPGETAKISPKIIIPQGAQLGVYQGYVRIKDGEEVSNIPFSARSVKEEFISSISRKSISSEVELTGHRSQGVNALFTVGSPIDSIEIYIKDYEKDKVIGYLGKVNAKGLKPGTYQIDYIIEPNPLYFPVKNEKDISPIISRLDGGKYKVEIRSVDTSGKVVSQQHPLLIDNDQVNIKSNIENDVYELSKDNMTVEKDDEGNDLEAFWIKGKVSDNSIKALKSIGLESSVKDLLVSDVSGRGVKIDEKGSFKIPITSEMVNGTYTGVLDFKLKGTDDAISHFIAPENSIFLKKGTPYIQTTAQDREVEKDDEVEITLSAKNIKNASKLKLPLDYEDGFKVVDVELNDKAKKILKKKGYKAKVSYKLNDNPYSPPVDINIEIQDSNGQPVNIDLNTELVDVELKLVDDTEFMRYTTQIESVYPSIVDKDGNKCDVVNGYGRMYETLEVIPEKSSARINATIIEGIGWNIFYPNFDLNKIKNNVWIESPEGKKYYAGYDQNTASFTSKKIPVSNKLYTAVIDVPGHFTSKTSFKPYVPYDGDLISKHNQISDREFDYNLVAGETNKDGVIDIMDAINVANNYNKEVTNKEMLNYDFNYDNKIDNKDMEYIIKNYLKVNYQQENHAEPKDKHNNETLEDVLNRIGYNENKSKRPNDVVELSEIKYFETDGYVATQGQISEIKTKEDTLYKVNDKNTVFVYKEEELLFKVKGELNELFINDGRGIVLVETENGKEHYTDKMMSNIEALKIEDN
ncbi:MAG: S8 family serine peptidase [Peptostreptococcaceae bacterium]